MLDGIQVGYYYSLVLLISLLSRSTSPSRIQDHSTHLFPTYNAYGGLTKIYLVSFRNPPYVSVVPELHITSQSTSFLIYVRIQRFR
jgi:hypothetical protein